MDIIFPTEELRPWQEEVWNTDKRKNKVLVIHRRAGKTWLCLQYLVAEALQNPNKIYHYVAPNRNQAKRLVWEPPDMQKKVIDPALIESRNETELKIFFKNGSQLYIHGADDPDRLRGIECHGVILDEYAQMKPEVYDAIYRPVLAASGGWVWFVGTPQGKNDFYKRKLIAKENAKKWHLVELKASESGLLTDETLAELRKEMPQNFYMQEMEISFIDDAGRIFRRISENIQGTFQEAIKTRHYQMGVDLAKYQDFTVIVVVDRHTHHVVYFERFNRLDWAFQRSRIENVARRYGGNQCTINIDSTGVGDPVVEELTRQNLTVMPYKFTNDLKEQMVRNLANLIEQNKITYPEIPELIRELEDYTYELLPSGRVRYNAPDGQHDDAVVATFLAFWNIGERMPITKKTTGRKNYGMDLNLSQSKRYTFR